MKLRYQEKDAFGHFISIEIDADVSVYVSINAGNIIVSPFNEKSGVTTRDLGENFKNELLNFLKENNIVAADTAIITENMDKIGRSTIFHTA